MISHWERLLVIARSIIDQSGIGDAWAFGGGTAMMVHIAARAGSGGPPNGLPILEWKNCPEGRLY